MKVTVKQAMAAAAIAVMACAPIVGHAQKGWKYRADRSADVKDPDAPGDIKFMEMNGGFHMINPQAAVYWNPANTEKGTYTLKGTFKLMKPSGHTNYYGLIFGGKDLEAANQSYFYFLVAQDGTYLVKKRDGDSTSMVVPKTMDESVQKPGADGTSVNALEVRVGASDVAFAVNGKVVKTMPKAQLTTDGVVGLRVNHLLEVMVTGFGAK